MGNSGKFVIEVFWKTILLAFLIIASCRSTRDLYAYAWSYVVGALALSYFALFFYDLQRYGTDFSYARLAGLATWDANDVVLVLMPALACALLVYQVVETKGSLRGTHGARRHRRHGGTKRFARRPHRTGGRGYCAAVLRRGVSLGKRIVTIVVVGAGLSVWAPQGYWRQMKSILSPKEDYNYTSKDGRKEIAKRGVGYMLGRPIFGLGIGNFEKAECSISDKARNTPAGFGIRCTPPHNSFVQAGAELGVPGLLLWASIPLYGIVSLLRLGSAPALSMATRHPGGKVPSPRLRVFCGRTGRLHCHVLLPQLRVARALLRARGLRGGAHGRHRTTGEGTADGAARGGAGRKQPAPGSRRHHGRASAGSSRPGAVSASAGHAAHCTTSARRPQFVVSGTIIITDADERAALAATRSLAGPVGECHLRHRKDLPRRSLPLFRKIGHCPRCPA